MKIKNKILSETSEEVKQRVRDTANKLVMKQETLEEAATKLLWKKYPYHPPRDSGYWQDMFIEGAIWQQERSYSEEDMRKAFIAGFTPKLTTTLNDSFNKWFEQFNKNT